MRNRFILGTVAALQMLSSAGFAQTLPSGTILNTSGANNVLVGGPGNYNYNQTATDNTKIAVAVLAQVQQLQTVDRAYLLEVANSFNAQLKELIALQNSFIKLSQQAQFDGVLLQSVLDVANQIRQKAAVLDANLATNTIISRESLPSYSPIGALDSKIEIGTVGNINFGPLVAAVNAQKAQVVADANALQFPRVKSPTGQVLSITQNALSPDIRGFYSLTSDQIGDLTKQLRTLQSPRGTTLAFYGQYTEYLVTLVNQFVNNYGNEEWFRFRNDNDKLALQTAYSQIVDAFYYRSYLRRSFNIRIGALQSKPYDKKILNFERFGIQPLKVALNSFRRESAITQTEVLQAFESARNFVELYDEKVTPVFASKSKIMANADKKLEYSSPDTGFIVRANSAITFITGQTRVAEVLLAIYRLALSDVREEMMLLENDPAALVNYHNQKYRSTPELKTAFDIKACRTDFTLTQTVQDQVCAPLGVKKKAERAIAMGGRSVVEIVSNILTELSGPEKQRRNEAKNLQLQIQMAQMSGSTETDSEDQLDRFN